MNKQSFGILIIHGFASSLDSVVEIERTLKPLGFPICMPVLRGHGGESPESLRGVVWQEWVTDAEAAFQSLLLQADKIIIIGHSMGGLCALNLAADHPDRVDSIILAAGAVRLANPLAPGAPLHFLVPVIRRVVKRWDNPPVYTDKSLIPFDRNYHWFPTDAAVELLEFSVKTRERLPEVRVPALIMQSRKDSMVHPESLEIIYKGITTPKEQKRTLWFEKTEHDMFQDCEREDICRVIKEFVQERI